MALIEMMLKVLFSVALFSNNFVCFGEEVCPAGPQEPQLSTTFFAGYWYEYLHINDILTIDPCAYFSVSCNENLTCQVNRNKWTSYISDQLYNATFTQDNDGVVMTFNETDRNISMAFYKDSVLVWGCNTTTQTNLDFASFWIKMDSDEDMETVWNAVESFKEYPEILQYLFPAGLWEKTNITGCNNAEKLKNSILNIFLIFFVYYFKTMLIVI